MKIFRSYRPSWRNALGATLLVCASVVVALLLMEGLLRLAPSLLPEDAQLQALRNGDRFEGRFIPDDFIGFRYPPERRIVHKSRDFAVVIRTDENGFRNDSPWPARADIVVVGDSMAFGYGVGRHHAWPRVLSRDLEPARLINLSLPGMGPPQYLRLFEKYGEPLRPRLLLFSIFTGNDVRDTKRFETLEATEDLAQWMANIPKNSSGWRARLDRSYLLLALRSARRNAHARLQSQTLELEKGGRVQLVPAHYDRDVELIRRDDVGFTGVIGSVEEARRLTQQLDVKLLVVLFPTKEEVYLPLEGRPYPDLRTPILDSLRDLGVEVLDLTPPLQREARRGEQVYFEVDGHPNDLGNEVIARILFDHIRDNARRYGLAHRFGNRMASADREGSQPQ